MSKVGILVIALAGFSSGLWVGNLFDDGYHAFPFAMRLVICCTTVTFSIVYIVYSISRVRP